MNKILMSGCFKKIAYKEGSSLMFKLGIRRDYKNKETGKHDYDNVTMYIPKFSKGTIDFVNKYVKDNDTVEAEGHVQTYTTEKDGQKIYHEDLICDTIRIISSKSSSGSNEAESSDAVTQDMPIEVAGEDCPW